MNTHQKTAFRMSTIAAGLLLAASASSYAGEALPSELPSMRTPVPMTAAIEVEALRNQVPLPVGEATAPEAVMQAMAMSNYDSISRADVREELAEAQEAGTLSAPGELADTPQVLAARAEFNEEQALEILAGYEAERARLAAWVNPNDPDVVTYSVVMVPTIYVIDTE
jgi:uncharacterized iron-regulated membrane protein